MTGTDTDVGKTRVCVSLACARRRAGVRPVIVKLVQTGVGANQPGDAQNILELTACEVREFARFPLAADPWTAALAGGVEPLEARGLAERVLEIPGDLIVEGSGGAAVPLNESETLADVAALAQLEALIVVGLRLGCINHALLTAEYLRARKVPVLGAVLVDRWGTASSAYRDQVRAAIAPSLPVVANLAHDPAPASATAEGAFDLHN